MNRTVRKIALILSIVILLPAVFFTVYEISSLNQNEAVLESIYTKQLDAILFTVNQYSEDVVRSYAAKINYVPAGGEITPSSLKKSLNEFKSLAYAAASSAPENIVDAVFDSSRGIDFRKEFIDAAEQNSEMIDRLYRYSGEGYQKLEPFLRNGYIHIFFVKGSSEEKQMLFDFMIDPGRFITELLAPKLRSVGQDQFILKILENNKTVFTTENDNRPVHLQRNIWLAPQYSLGILLKGTTIEELVESRFYTTIVIIAVLGIILVAGLWIVFGNIKREIELAHIKSDFVSNVSHELRTPLALISMFAETLDMGRVRTEEKKKEYIKIISQETNRLSGIVNKILSFSKMEAGKRTFTFTDTDLNEVAAKVYETYKFHLQNKGFASSLNPAEDLPQVKIDADAVSEALVNLIDNAMKYSEDKKDVRISTGLQDGYVFLEVKDKGIGISEENQSRVFEKFFRVTSGLVHNTKGTGLGLTLVKQIVEAHKGKIELKSRMWEGSTFRLLFPVKH